MTDRLADAETLFRDFARRHSFVIENMDEPNVDLLMRMPRQPGLSFELTLGLQNIDELNIGFEKFWSYFFPFDHTRQIVSDALDALATGECRLAIHKQMGGVFKRVLEQRVDGQWITIYTAHSFPKIPFVSKKVLYLYNEDARRR